MSFDIKFFKVPDLFEALDTCGFLTTISWLSVNGSTFNHI
jgi:hypothetical protein